MLACDVDDIVRVDGLVLRLLFQVLEWLSPTLKRLMLGNRGIGQEKSAIYCDSERDALLFWILNHLIL